MRIWLCSPDVWTMLDSEGGGGHGKSPVETKIATWAQKLQFLCFSIAYWGIVWTESDLKMGWVSDRGQGLNHPPSLWTGNCHLRWTEKWTFWTRPFYIILGHFGQFLDGHYCSKRRAVWKSLWSPRWGMSIFLLVLATLFWPAHYVCMPCVHAISTVDSN